MGKLVLILVWFFYFNHLSIILFEKPLTLFLGNQRSSKIPHRYAGYPTEKFHPPKKQP